jgi:hypothetical protein
MAIATTRNAPKHRADSRAQPIGLFNFDICGVPADFVSKTILNSPQRENIPVGSTDFSK